MDTDVRSLESLQGLHARARRFSDTLRLALPFSERRALLLGGDIAMTVLAGLIALAGWWMLYPQFVSFPVVVQNQIKWLGILALAWVIGIAVNEGYDLQSTVQISKNVRLLLVSAAEVVFLYLLIFFFWGRGSWADLVNTPPTVTSLPRITPGLFFLSAPLLSLLARLGYVRLCNSSLLRRRVIVVGAGQAGRAFVQAVRQAMPHYEIVGYVDDDPAKEGRHILGLPVLGDRYSLIRWVQKGGINEVVLAITHEIHADLFRALVTCYELGVEVRPMPLVYEEVLGRVPVEHLGQKWFLAPLWTVGKMPTVQRVVKRLLDIVLALIGLAVLIVLLPLLALAIYVDSPGPIFYSQERVGLGGRAFRLYKLRSMVPAAEQHGEAVWASEDDPRITRVGRFLRRTRLDELPQLLNVLRGEMSIVGPRPERPQFVEQLQEQIPFYRTRLSVKPGLTGWAQIKYGYGNSVEDALMKLQYDLYYVKHHSLFLDALIVLRTIKVMLAFKGT